MSPKPCPKMFNFEAQVVIVSLSAISRVLAKEMNFVPKKGHSL
jgi:hypothetical protein